MLLSPQSPSSNGSENMVPGTAASVSPGNSLGMQISSRTPDLLNQKLCGWGPAGYVLMSPPGSSDAQ